ncbi:ATP-grasp domain-containing protein [Evansella halocellulosilytica]|uniref:ATP-grasp domain-containing protein n=1 Tax=Evansella halocellulosilytica TaxID=2011013 RepID=UPI000BB8E5F7|nr:hypothetical protein [Evansella halocellulosilytica]
MNKKHGMLIYRKEDIARNKVFIDLLMKASYDVDRPLMLITYEEMALQVAESNLFLESEESLFPSFIINRSVSHWINEIAESKEIRSFNSAKIARIANDKRLTHSTLSKIDIPMLTTIHTSKETLVEHPPLDFPFVVKNPFGRGGTDVHLIDSADALKEVSSSLHDELIVQPVGSAPGKDVRVFVIGNQIIGAVLRESFDSELRANISLGGSSKIYELNEDEKSLINKIIDHLKPDFVGLDFLLDENGKLTFNEMEDAVGCRSLYMNSEIDIAALFMKYVAEQT